MATPAERLGGWRERTEMITDKLRKNVATTCSGKTPEQIWDALKNTNDEELRQLLDVELSAALRRSRYRMTRQTFESLQRLRTS